MIKRYNMWAFLNWADNPEVDIEEDSNGDWVKYEDHEAKVFELEEKLNDILRICND